MNSAQHQPRPSRWNPRLPLSLSESSDLATASMMLAARDIPVFPCTPGGKQPLTSHGFHDATSNVAAVRNWWQRWPGANIGIPTGAPSGVDVVDIDVHPGGNGFGAFERATAAGIAAGWAWLVRTPSGGVHAYYLRQGAGEQRSWQVPGQHVDFRGDGGYIVAPPSRVGGRSYDLIAHAQHRPTPVDAGSLRAFLEPPPRLTRPRASMPAIGSRPDKLADWVASRPTGARNQGLFWAACRMVEDGHAFDTTVALLGEAARSAGLSDQEATTTIRSAYRIASRLGAANIARPSTAAEAVAL